ncbi:hypothetical protein METP3_01419 [Methanosarcinales archaeon]|nr:hypothetical protein METP3_01419 [Methanosarcinales archaeon]
MFFKDFGSKVPSRLFVAGVHGNEEAATMPILELLAKDIKIISGRLILVSLSSADPYISTLDKAYYGSINGMKLLELVREYRPTIYLEVHSYEIRNHAKLIDPERKSKIGVPPFTELEEKILIGSVSPFIRTTEFNREDLCFTLELPIPHSEKALQVALDILRVIALSSSRNEIIGKLRIKYPEQISEAERNFYEFFNENTDVSFF